MDTGVESLLHYNRLYCDLKKVRDETNGGNATLEVNLYLSNTSQDWIPFLSLFITAVALYFTITSWIIDQIESDIGQFIKDKAGLLRVFNSSYQNIRKTSDLNVILYEIQNIDERLEIILSYRFWTIGKYKKEYGEEIELIKEFFNDSQYLVSALRRSQNESVEDSIISVLPITPIEMEDIRLNYIDGLMFIIEFFGNLK